MFLDVKVYPRTLNGLLVEEGVFIFGQGTTWHAW